MSDRVSIKTDDGLCPAWEFHPAGTGPWPGVLLYMDGIGIRPAMHEIAERLAKGGYFVLLPDLYYRAGAYEPMNAMTVFADPEQRTRLREKFMATTTTANMMRDTRVFFDHLASKKEVRGTKFGTTGYCMGGRLSLCATDREWRSTLADSARSPE